MVQKWLKKWLIFDPPKVPLFWGSKMALFGHFFGIPDFWGSYGKKPTFFSYKPLFLGQKSGFFWFFTPSRYAESKKTQKFIREKPSDFSIFAFFFKKTTLFWNLGQFLGHFFWPQKGSKNDPKMTPSGGHFFE